MATVMLPPGKVAIQQAIQQWGHFCIKVIIGNPHIFCTK